MLRVLTGGLLICGIVCFIACGGGGGAGNNGAGRGAAKSPAEKPKSEQYGGEIDAQIYAEDFVRDNLKWPDDAEFPLFSQSAVLDEERGQWVVRGKVKAKNSFGAELTHDYVCTLFRERKGDRYLWRCRYLQIGDDVLIADLKTATPKERQAAADAAEAESEPEATKSAEEKAADETERRAGRVLNAARSYLGQGEKQKARDALDRLLERYPDTEAAESAQQILAEEFE